MPIEIQPNESGIALSMKQVDIISPVLPLIKSGAMYIDVDGKIKIPMSGAEPQTPWIHPRCDHNRDCGLWHAIMFNHYGFIPSQCFECWKIVVSPRTLKELWQLLELQEDKWEGPCKCGIEVRDITPRIYGGYFYNDSLDEGQENYRKVRKLVDELISPDVPIILKRACTEFEMKFGPSNNWKLQPGQLEKEEAITNLFDRQDQASWEQVPAVRPRVMRAWIQWAFKHGDMTYLEFNGNKPLYPETVKYHELDLSTLTKTTMEVVRRQ